MAGLFSHYLLQKSECLLITAPGHEVLKAGGQACGEPAVGMGDFLGDSTKGVKLSLRVAVSEPVVGNDCFPPTQEVCQFAEAGVVVGDGHDRG